MIKHNNCFLKFIFFLLFFIPLLGKWSGHRAFAQNNCTISGTVKDKKTGEVLIGALIIVKDIPSTGTSANDYGFYSLSLKEGKYTLSFRFASYVLKDTTIDLRKN